MQNYSPSEMKKFSIILACFLVALAACTKSKEVHPELGDGNYETISFSENNASVEYIRADAEELQKVLFYYSPIEVHPFTAVEMIQSEGSFELTLDNLYSNMLYCYYFELFYKNGYSKATDYKVFRAKKTIDPELPILNENHDYVDLGLPSGLLWATCNLGANMPEEFGNYFAWGETRTKYVFLDITYKYCEGDGFSLTKYCYNPINGYNGYTDNLRVLLPEDDAATVNRGTGWRMPTEEEWRELCQNTTPILTTQNNVKGVLFNAPNGNSIFLPAAGEGNKGSYYYVGQSVLYWSSSLDSNSNCNPVEFSFFSDGYNLGSRARCVGHTVRAVFEQR